MLPLTTSSFIHFDKLKNSINVLCIGEFYSNTISLNFFNEKCLSFHAICVTTFSFIFYTVAFISSAAPLFIKIFAKSGGKAITSSFLKLYFFMSLPTN